LFHVGSKQSGWWLVILLPRNVSSHCVGFSLVKK
jgi:hypothetical protein